MLSVATPALASEASERASIRASQSTVVRMVGAKRIGVKKINARAAKKSSVKGVSKTSCSKQTRNETLKEAAERLACLNGIKVKKTSTTPSSTEE